MAFIGGSVTLEMSVFRIIVGIALLIAALRMFVQAENQGEFNRVNWWIAAPVGAVLGLVSGLTGVGGGIYLSPIVLLLGWTGGMRAGSAALASAFILLNSIAGLAGFIKQERTQGGSGPKACPILSGPLFWVGSLVLSLAHAPSRQKGLRSLLGIVLLVAGAKMIATA